MKVQAGTWQFDPSSVVINGETHNLVDEGYVSHDNGNGTWTVGEANYVAQIGDKKYTSLQKAVDAAEANGGENTIVLLDDITGETVTIKENAGLKVTIDGQKDDSSNYTVDAIIVVDGLRGNGGSKDNGASVTLQNIAFVNGDYVTAQNASIIQPSHYPHHLTIQDCTYTGKDTEASRGKWFMDVTDGPLYGATVKNVTVEHTRLIQGNFGLDVVFENITATNDAKVGFNIKTEGTVLIKDCQITTSKYAFRDYSDGYVGTITLEGNTFISTSTESDEGAIVNRGGADDGEKHIIVNSGTYVGAITILTVNKLLLVDGHYSAPIYEDGYADYIVEGSVGKKDLYPDDTAAPNGIGDPVYVAQIGETKYTTLQKAVDAAHEMTGDITIELLEDIEEYAVVKQKSGLNLTIDGLNKTITGQIIANGVGSYNGTETLTIKNINFVGNKDNFDTGDAFVYFPPKSYFANQNYNYAHNVTVFGCSFTSTSDNFNSTTNETEYDVVGVKVPSSSGLHNITITESTGTNLHSLAQLVGTKDATVTNNTVSASESFLNVNGGEGDFTVSGNTFTSAEGADGYGVRENGSSTAVITLTENNFTAENAVVLGKGNSATAGTINVESGTYVGDITKTDAATGKIVISGGRFSAPIGDAKYSQFIAENLTGVNGIHPDTPEAPNGIGTAVATVTYSENNVSNYASFEAAVEAARGEYVITLLQNIPDTYTMSVGETLKVNKNGCKLELGAPEGYVVKSAYKNPVYTYTVTAIDYMFTDLKGNVKYGTWVNTTTTISKSGTYKLLADVNLGVRVVPGTSADDVTLDLNGFTFTSTATDCGILLSGLGTSSKIFNLIDSSEEKGGKFIANDAEQGISVNVNNYNVTIGEGVTFEGSVNLLKANDKLDVYGTIVGGDDFAVSTNGSTTTNATIIIHEGAVLTSGIVAMYLPGTGTTTISGGEITGATAIDIRSGVLNITGGTITGTSEKVDYEFVSGKSKFTGDAVLIENCNYPGGDPVVSISGGTMVSTNADAVVSYGNEGVGKEPVVAFATGGFYSNQIPQEYCAEGYICAPFNEELYIVREAEYVAQIGDVKYESLAEAVAAVPTDGTETTITMIGNETINVNLGPEISANQNVILDLNGMTITQTAPDASVSYLIQNKGTLTIMDSSDTNKDGTGTGKMKSTAEKPSTSYGYATNLISNRGNLTIESGYLESATRYASYVVDNYTNGNAVINGGHLYNYFTSAIRLFCNSTTADNAVTVNGGTVEGYCTIWVQGANNNKNKGSLTINGGHFKTTEKKVVEGTTSIVDSDSYIYMYPSNENMSITITDGTFDTNFATWGDGNVSILGGTFNGYVYCEDKEQFILGGLFIDEPDASYAKEGYVFGVYNLDPNYYTLIQAVAQNVETGKKYDDLSFAINAAEAGQTIKLLANVTLADDLTADKNFTIQTNGFTLSPAGHTVTINSGVTVTLENPASLIDIFVSAESGFNVEETVTANGYAYSLKAVENLDLASIDEGYFHIKNLGSSKYVNVVGRRTATVTTSEEDAAKSAGAVIKVKTTNGKVEILRSQAVDIPHYAARAMSYVPDVVRMLVTKLGFNGSGKLLGENGVDAILEKFNNSVDPNLYVENCGDGYRIFGRTPSMQPVLDFYKENKDNVDAKLPMLEDAINLAISQVIQRTGMGSSFKNSFSLHTIWERMGAANLTEPNDDASKLAFLQEVLSSQNHVWNFAFQTATFYMEKVEGSDYYNMMPSEIATYWNRIKQIHPNFKYYIVQTDGKLDIISEGNIDIINKADRAIWKLEPVTDFTLNVPATNWKENEEGVTEYYTTLYTDFGYQLPAGAVAMKVTGVKETTVAAIESDCIGLAETETIGQQVAPQTPVLIKSKNAGDITLTIGDNFGAAIDESTNLLHGVDWLINEYEVNSPVVEDLFLMINLISSSASETYDFLDQHEYLQRLNSGTVGNKYFFGLNIDETFAKAYKAKTGNEMETPIRILDMLDGERLVFNESWDNLMANRAFIFSEEYNPVVFSMLYVAENVEKETGYETIDEAFTEVGAGQTIRLLDNVVMAKDQTADKSFTLKTEGFTFDPAGHTITIAQEGVTVNVEIAASIIDNFASAAASYTVEETVTANGYAYSLKPVENLDLATIGEGYYHIKNVGNESYVNVLGRRTALVNLSEADAAKAAGALIKVKATNGKVEILRSQAVDIPSYAQRAMRYVPEVVTLVVEKLGVDGSGKILGENGVDAILTKFYNNFDYNLYVENAEGGYRIFGRTPSMQPVLDFYKENKANVDAKLPGLEQAINDAISKVVNKIGRGYSLEGSFQLHTIWERMGAENLTEPNDEASKLAFLQEVLSSKNHVWNFAYQTATFYSEKVEGRLDQVSDVLEGVDVSKYIELAKKIRPDFKYYIVQKDGKLDIISEGNTDIIGNVGNAIWQLEEATAFTLNVPEANSRLANAVFNEDHVRTSVEKAYYTTLYTDFGYQLPEGAVALKVTEIKQTKIGEDPIEGLGLIVTEEIGQNVAPQTPVLIMSDTAGDISLTIDDSCGEPIDENTNLLHGPDWLINEYEINTPMLETLYSYAAGVSPSIAEQYEHLIRRNAGTVNNKYFFGLDIDQDLAPAYKKKTGNEMEKNPILILSKKEGKKLAFNANEDWGKIGSNSAFIFSEEFNPAVFSLLGDVTRDGIIDVDDVTGQVNIIQFRDKKEYNYDYEAADVIVDEEYDVDDVTGLVNIIQGRTQHPDIP